MTIRSTIAATLVLLLGAAAIGCSDDEAVASEADARRAYMGLDRMVGLAMDLGFAGFNAASSANIPPQNGTGELRGTIGIGGQVDQGSSDNKGMRLTVTLADYTDKAPDEKIPTVSYDTKAAPAALTLSLKKIPNGTLEGSLNGAFAMSGGLQGDVTLALTIAGQLEPAATGGGVQRKPGTTRVSGSASSPYGSFAVDLTR